jgi:hypothetical protein
MIKMKQESLIEELLNSIPVKIGLIGIVVSEDKNQETQMFSSETTVPVGTKL